jgi:hypothetical protein
MRNVRGIPSFAQPPIGMKVPHTAEVVTTLTVALVLFAMVIGGAIAWRRTRSNLYPFLLIGAVLACIDEPIMDMLAPAWHARYGQWIAFQTFGRPIPVWVVLAYPILFWGFPCIVYALLQRGVTRRQVWIGAGIAAIGDLVFEIPILHGGLYVYYGYQPFKIGGFPIPWMFINGLCVLSMAAVLVASPDLCKGRRAVLLVALPIASQLATAAIGLPLYSVLNTDAPHYVKWLGATATIVIGIIAFDSIAKFISVKRPRQIEKSSSLRDSVVELADLQQRALVNK